MQSTLIMLVIFLKEKKKTLEMGMMTLIKLNVKNEEERKNR